MRIALLARNQRAYTHLRLQEAALERGHDFDIVHTYRCFLAVGGGSKEGVHFDDGRSLARYDGVIPRIGASTTSYGLLILRQFEIEGALSLNDPNGIGFAADKLATMQTLARSGIEFPKSVYAHYSRHAGDVIQAVGGAPVIIKLLEGALGLGVILADTERTAKSVIKAFRAANVNILVQEFVAESAGSDIRAIVLGDRVVAAMRRQGAKGEFRSNLHRGGSADAIELSEHEQEIAIRAAKAIGLEFCGVDLVLSHRGPLVLEVNASPGLEGVEKATGLDIAGMVIEHMAALIEAGQRRCNLDEDVAHRESIDD